MQMTETERIVLRKAVGERVSVLAKELEDAKALLEGINRLKPIPEALPADKNDAWSEVEAANRRLK